MWPFRKKKRHLRYNSVEAWFWGERLKPINEYSDPAERNRLLTQLGELRQHLFDKNFATLSPEEQQQLNEGTHPSQSHRFFDRAEPFVGLFREHLATLGFTAEVDLGGYHCDRIVICVAFDTDLDKRVHSRLPAFFHGFEIKYSWPQTRRSVQ